MKVRAVKIDFRGRDFSGPQFSFQANDSIVVSDLLLFVAREPGRNHEGPHLIGSGDFGGEHRIIGVGSGTEELVSIDSIVISLRHCFNEIGRDVGAALNLGHELSAQTKLSLNALFAVLENPLNLGMGLINERLADSDQTFRAPQWAQDAGLSDLVQEILLAELLHGVVLLEKRASEVISFSRIFDSPARTIRST